jgi:hypothetical protein
MWFSVQTVAHECWLTNGNIVDIPRHRCGAEVLINKLVFLQRVFSGFRRCLKYLRSSGTLLSVDWIFTDDSRQPIAPIFQGPYTVCIGSDRRFGTAYWFHLHRSLHSIDWYLPAFWGNLSISHSLTWCLSDRASWIDYTGWGISQLTPLYPTNGLLYAPGSQYTGCPTS